MPLRPPRVTIRRVEIEGFKSIRSASLDLQAVNVLIGANGAGKSNLASFLSMVPFTLDGYLDGYVNLHGGGNAVLHQGAKATDRIAWQMEVSTEEGNGVIAQELAFKAPDALAYASLLTKKHTPKEFWTMFVNGDVCAVHAEQGRHHAIKIFDGIRQGLALYHFHDTSLRGPLRTAAEVTATVRLDDRGSNLPAILHAYEQAEKDHSSNGKKGKYGAGAFARISRNVRKFFPGFGQFVLVPEADERRILLRWRHREYDYIYGPHQLSDGTLRAIALITLLLQPKEDLPNLIVIDEPELGLHPVGIELIANLIQAVSLHCQVIVSTQSTTLLDFFDPEQIIVVDADKGASRFRRLEKRHLSRWLKNYSVSELWQKNVVGGGPLP